jgi:hypothetical protein
MPGPISWAARRPTAAAALIYAVLSLAMFAPALAPGRTLSVSDYLWTATPWDSTRPAHVPVLGSNREQTDSVFMFQPFLQHTRAELPDIPLWNPYIMGGRPFQANSQSAVLSPFSVPAYVLPFWDSLAWMAALHLFIAALGAFLLARAFGMRFLGALLCGLVFGFSLWSVSWVSWTTMSVWAWLPFLCLLSELCLRRPGPLPFAGLATVVGVQFLGGHPSSSFQVMVCVALFWLVRALTSRPLRERDLVLRLLTFGGALGVGTALAAITLIPFAELLSHSIDIDARTAAASDAHEPARYLLGIFLHDWWGRGSRVPLEFASKLEEHAYYVAALPLMLAASALVLAPRRERIVVAGVGAVALAVATGIPPFFDIVKSLPGFDAARNGRLAVISVLCVAVLAGWALDDLTGSGEAAAEKRKRLVLAVCGFLLVLPAVWVARRIDIGSLGDGLRIAWGFASPGPDGDAIRMASLLEWLLPAALAVVLVWLRLSGRLGVPAFAGLALALVVLDLFKAGMGYNPAIPERDAVQPATPAIRYLQGQRPNRFAGLHPEAPITLAVPIPPNVAMRYGLYDARGYDYPAEKRYDRLWRRNVAPGVGDFTQPIVLATATPAAVRALSLLSVTAFMQDPGEEPLRAPGLQLAYDKPDARVYRNPAALPRVFLAGRQQTVAGEDEALRAVTAPGFDARNVAVTESTVPGIAQDAGGGAGTAELVSYGAERVVTKATARRRSLLVLTDVYFPGWKATVDGHPVPIERVDYLLRGVVVPPGTHRVEFSYEPSSFRAGWIIAVLGLLAVLATVAVGLRRRGRE